MGKYQNLGPANAHPMHFKTKVSMGSGASLPVGNCLEMSFHFSRFRFLLFVIFIKVKFNFHVHTCKHIMQIAKNTNKYTKIHSNIIKKSILSAVHIQQSDNCREKAAALLVPLF